MARPGNRQLLTALGECQTCRWRRLRAGRACGAQSVTSCPFTTDQAEAPLFRLLIEPDAVNGLDAPSRIMVDKITTVRRSRLGLKSGVLDDANVLRLNRALVVTRRCKRLDRTPRRARVGDPCAPFRA